MGDSFRGTLCGAQFPCPMTSNLQTPHSVHVCACRALHGLLLLCLGWWWQARLSKHQETYTALSSQNNGLGEVAARLTKELKVAHRVVDEERRRYQTLLVVSEEALVNLRKELCNAETLFRRRIETLHSNVAELTAERESALEGASDELLEAAREQHRGTRKQQIAEKKVRCGAGAAALVWRIQV